MAAPELTPSGVEIQTFKEIYDQKADALKLIYGSDINLDPNTADGQRIGIESKLLLDIQAFALNLYNSIDPDLAIGMSLDSAIKNAGIRRRPASLSQVDVNIVTSRALTLSKGYQVQDDIGQIWETDEELSLLSGSNSITLFSEKFGAVDALPNTVNNPVTIIIGVTSVDNTNAATVGSEEESDADLKIRRNRSLENPSTSTIGGMFSSLGNISGVVKLSIKENDTDTYDPVLDLNAHSIWIIIEGGSIDDITETMVYNKTAGTGMKGAIESIFTENIELENGLGIAIQHKMKFDRPDIVDLFVNLTVSSKISSIVDETSIKDALAAENYNIGQIATASELYSNAYGAQNNLTVTALEISDDNITFTDASIVPTADVRFRIEPANVIITVI